MGIDEALFRFFMNRMRVTTATELLQFQADADILFFHRRVVAGTANITSKAYFLRHLKRPPSLPLLLFKKRILSPKKSVKKNAYERRLASKALFIQ